MPTWYAMGWEGTTMSEHRTHPFEGEKLSYEQGLKFWDDYSEQYSGFQQGDIPRRIVRHLLNHGIMNPKDSVLEIGSGPGTYSLEIAPLVSRITCLDTSPRMLERLRRSAEEMGLDNMDLKVQDWNEFSSQKEYDVAIATLCPGSGTPESICRMESASRNSCVLVSWLENHGDDLNASIWNELGREYGYGFRKSTAVQDWLRENDRNPTVEFFETTVVSDIPLEAVVAKERSAFHTYGLEKEAEEITRRLLEPEIDDGVWHYEATNSMKLIYWESR